MMNIIVSGRNIQLTQAIKAYVTEKVRRLDQHYDFVKELHVFLTVEKNPSIHEGHRAEATVHVLGAVVRIRSTSTDLYGSIDRLVDKVDRSLAKHKTKLLHRHLSGKHAEEAIRVTTVEQDDSHEHDEEDPPEELYLTYQDEETPAELTSSS